MAYGTPRRPEDIEAYYTDVRRGRPPTPELLADLVRRYTAIGGLSPLLERTEAQAAGLRRALEARAPGQFRVELGLKHAAPFIEETVDRVVRRGGAPDRRPRPRPALQRLLRGPVPRAGRGNGPPPSARRVEVLGIEEWHLEPAYLDFLADQVAAGLADLPARTRVLFTAHSLPSRIVDLGDPYPDQLRATAEAVAERAGLDRRSRAGPRRGRAPAAPPSRGSAPTSVDVIRDVAATGEADGVLVCPCGFVSDHLEILYDLDLEARAVADEAGIAFARTAVVNDDADVLAALAHRVVTTVLTTPSTDPGRGPVHVVVVGGGVAGLAAAHHLLGTPGVEVTLLEADDRLGGKIRTEPFAGLDLDTGPDAFLARRPEAVALCRELGLDEALVAPATTAASLWIGGRLRPLPARTLLGVPTDLARPGPLEGALAAGAGPGRDRAAAARPSASAPGDAAIGALVRRRLGREAAERLVDPLIGGINAGITTELSVDAVAPQMAAAARRHRSLTLGAREILAAAAGPGAPVFLTLPGGLGRLVDALAARLAAAGATVRTGHAGRGARARPGRGLARPDRGIRRGRPPGRRRRAGRPRLRRRPAAARP